MQEYFDNENFSDDEEEQTTVKRDAKWTKPIKKAPESTAKMQSKREISKSPLDVQTESMNILREYAASKLRKLTEQVLTEQAMETVKFNNVNALMQERNQRLLPITNLAEVNVTSILIQGKSQNVFITLNPMGLPVQRDINCCFFKNTELEATFSVYFIRT